MKDAALSAEDGDIILVDPGVYPADVTRWKQNDLMIWAPEGRAHFKAEGAAESNKAIWMIEGRNFTAENIEFSGARVRDRNGAGVRIHANGKVTLRNCYFHDNENGVLGDADEILIDRCVFDRNGSTGSGDAEGHNLYVWGTSVTIQNSYIHRGLGGHDVKTRGETNTILANRIMDEADGSGSYPIDVPDCGRTYIIGNVIELGVRSRNYHLISYGAEGDRNRWQELYIVNNTMVNNGRPDGFFVKIRKGTNAQITNNIFYGPGTPWVGGIVNGSHNYIQPPRDDRPRFSDPASYDFHLTADSPRDIVDRGIPPGRSSTGFDLAPSLEYVYDARGRARPVSGDLDLGAFEYTRPEVSPDSSAGGGGGESVQAPASRGTETGRPAKAKGTPSKKKKASAYPARSARTPQGSEPGR